ncbi:MAG: OmpA family protein [Mariprofundales bacterium]
MRNSCNYCFFYTVLFCCISCISFIIVDSPAAIANEVYDNLRQDIAVMVSSEDGQFAPDTLSRAQAYLGAAMLAVREQRQASANDAFKLAKQMLQEALRLAKDYKDKHAHLLDLRHMAKEAVLDASDAEWMQAEDLFRASIRDTELGKLNASTKHAQQAATAYRALLDTAMPRLLRETASVLGSARSKSAHKYAPITYNAAEHALAQLEIYQDNPSMATMPEHPGSGLRLARRALELTQKIRDWRGEKESHEILIEQARSDRLRLAIAVGMNVDSSQPLLDISQAKLAEQIIFLQKALRQERNQRMQDITQLKQECDKRIATMMDAERQRLRRNSSEQMDKLKQAYQAKLEQETYEQKRQERLQSLFKTWEAKIMLNGNGSILLRVSGLKFASGKYDVSPRYYDLLGRIKEGLDIYNERQIDIEGHTDSQGDVRMNQKMSLNRAESVRDFLIAAGSDASSLRALGYGEVRPIASNDFEKGRAMNRRIDFVIKPARN